MKIPSQFSYLRLIQWLLICVFSLFPCHPQEASPNEAGAKLSLISESKTLGNNPKIWVGLRVQMKPGWKAYWRSPGVAGYGVRFNWDGLSNIKSPVIYWPIPHRFPTEFGTVNVYEGDFILPVSLEVLDLSKPVQGDVKVDMLICDKSLCVPVQETLTFNLGVGPRQENKDDAMKILKAMSQVPSPQNNTSIHVESAEISGNDIPPTIRVRLSKLEGFDPSNLPVVFMEIQDYFLDAPLVKVSSDLQSVVYSALVFPNEYRLPSPIPNLVGKPLKLTIGLQNQGNVFGFETQATLQTQSLTLFLFVSILVLAFVGGLILNIMPCVLPVLSLKVLSVMRQGGRHYKHIRQEFMATVFGIIFSFLILALGEIVLKSAGLALGWGVQFQEPIFVIALVAILTIFSASLFGFFEFRLPYFLASIGGVHPQKDSLVGSFLEGTLVTILATPCTAPLVGTALAFSLSRGSLEIISVFCMMGLGLSFPFLIMALFPALASKLPKPGAWMIRVKVILGFLLILTVIWLLFVLKGQIGMQATFIIAALMLFALAILFNINVRSDGMKKVSWVMVSLLIVGSGAFTTFVHLEKADTVSMPDGLWQPFDPDKIAQHVQDNKVVFVNVTADWCLTCQVNKYFALQDLAVVEELKKSDVVAMEADWSNHNLRITAYLESFNQYGIPFYAVYGCKNRTGIFLGQVLTPKTVIEAIKAERCNIQQALETSRSLTSF